MTVREYIGARYIPLFIGEWDSDNSYEPLSVVQYLGNSYTSRQYVPVGIPITNEQYWVETGNYNSQIEAYRQEVLAYNNRIASLENKFPITANDITNGTITEAKMASNSVGYSQIKNGAITPVKLNDDTIKRFWAKNISIENTNMVVFGDSYTQDGIANSLNAYWPKRVAGVLNTNLFNYAIAGAGFGRDIQPISRQQENCAANMTEEQANNTSIVICMAGCNDLLNDIPIANINTGITNFMTWASNFFPYAEIYIIPFNWGFSKLTNSMNTLITNCFNSIMTYNAQRIHIIPYAWCWNLGIASRFQNEVHPNTSGYNQISAHILAAINGVETNAFNTGNTLNLQNNPNLNSGYLTYNMRNGILNVNGYIRPTVAGAQNITIYAAGNMPAILTPNNSLFVLSLIDSTNHKVVGNITFNATGSLVANFTSDVAANDVCCFNGTFIPEVGVNWSDYVQ